MARIPNPFQRSNDRRRKRTRAYDSTTAMRLGIDLTRPDRSRTGHPVHTSQVDLRRKRTRAHVSSVQHQAPTVMVRNIAASQPAAGATRSQKKARRRFDIAFGLPGTEVRLPNLPQIAISWRWLSAVLTVVLGFVVYQVWNASTFQVAEVQVSGLQRLTPNDVNNMLGLEGKPIFSLDSGELENELLQTFPEFSAATVQVGLPNSVAITITERVPVLVWMMNGSPTLVDREGMGFPARGESSSLTVPVVDALAMPPPVARVISKANAADLTVLATQTPESTPLVGAQPFLKPEFISAVLALREQAPEGVPLLYDGTRGFGWRDPGGWDVYFGNAQDMAMKLLVYQEIIARLDDQEETLPSLVSVENVHAPYYRPR